MSAVAKALLMMGIALPVMFAVIAIFMVATTALHKAFPAPAEEEGDDEDDDYDDDFRAAITTTHYGCN